jgi:hypothetical protein
MSLIIGIVEIGRADSLSGFLGFEDIQHFANRLFKATFGHADVVGSDARAAMGRQTIEPAGADRIMQLGVDQ